MKINLVGLGPCQDTIVKKVADGWGTGQTKKIKDALLTEGQLERRPLRSTLHCPVTALLGRQTFCCC